MGAYRVIKSGDSAYPSRLASFNKQPDIYYIGDLDLISDSYKTIAIVGKRNATSWGREFAYDVAVKMARAGWVVISGMARGIDTAAHKGAVETGRTVAVLGTGIDVVYPRSNYKLYNEIGRKGLIISIFPPGTPGFRYNFPRRNLVMAYLADVVLVIEASSKSGALITARYAMKLGKKVYAVPGALYDPNYKGTNMLIKEGAKLFESVEDIIERGSDSTQVFAGKDVESSVLKLIEEKSPLTVEEIVNILGKDVSVIQMELIELEIKGLVKRMAGGYYERVKG